jgi:hypothetical protein
MNDYLCDHDGNKSSKRLWGTILLSNGILLKNAEWGIAIFKVAANAQMMMAASETLIYAGAALLGIGVAELFAKKKDKEESA